MISTAVAKVIDRMCFNNISTLNPNYLIITGFMLNSEMSMKIQLFTIKIKMLKNKEFSCFRGLSCCIYHALRAHFINYEHDQVHVQLN